MTRGTVFTWQGNYVGEDNPVHGAAIARKSCVTITGQNSAHLATVEIAVPAVFHQSPTGFGRGDDANLMTSDQVVSKRGCSRSRTGWSGIAGHRKENDF